MTDERPGQRLVAGLWCGEVLERLPDLVDGALTPEDRASVDAHLAGCDWCARFGGSYIGVVRAVARPAAPAPVGVAERLRAKLRQLG
ncbi:MAG: zf-HC2 domain-containing protein [Myxococcota bacterium]